jgi:integral membrane protein (TIGR00529 family)
MVILLKIALIIFLLLFLIKLKWDLGIILVLDSILVAILFGLNIKVFARNFLAALVSGETLSLVGILILVLYLGNFLQWGGHFRMMVDALKNLVSDPRLILAIPSAFIGLLPMMAGAMMGAPIVDEAGRRWNLTPAWKTFLNYWFRHIWEYSWPLYLNLIIAAAIVKVPIMKICLYQAPFTIIAAAAGLVILFRHVPYLPRENDGQDRKYIKDSFKVFFSIWPIILTIILIFLFRLPMLLSLGISAVLTQVTARMSLRERWEVIQKSISLKIVLLVAALMIFKRILEVSGALDSVVRVVRPEGVSAYILLFAAPFFVGLLTGVNQAFVAIGFPLLVPIMGAGHPDMVLVLFAYVSGFVGILLSPAHLCLALTADYFKAELRDVYKILIWPVSVVFGFALLALVIFRIL